ncbi:MAG TPA: winged helix-turn-helix domain-containing protein [Terriglobales bacterium]|nr:winged helix-turn-helix domain-containing protein [Terriglobales bacterium]
MARVLLSSLTPPTMAAPNPDFQAEAGRYRFGDFRLCLAQRQLWRNGETVSLTPRALDLLIALVRCSGRVVGREELLRRVWGDISVHDSNLTVNLCLLRRALGSHERLIATVPGRGYQFVAPVVPEAAAEPRLAEEPAVTWLGVAPFQSVGESPLSPVLGTALGPALVAALARIPGLRVRPSSAQAGSEVDWRLEGWFQQFEQTVRITAQLVRTEDGGVEWAEHRHFAAAEIFELQDRIAAWLKAVIRSLLAGERALGASLAAAGGRQQ